MELHEEIVSSPEEIFINEKLNLYSEIEVSLKRLKKRFTSDLQTTQSQKLLDSLKEYSTIVCNVPEMKEIGECVEQVAAAHNLFDEMINKVLEIVRTKITPAIQQTVREFKHCSELSGRFHQYRADYENHSRTLSIKSDVSSLVPLENHSGKIYNLI